MRWETKQIIYELRTKSGMSQDELADKIMVTRQAVSRWENGASDYISKPFSLAILRARVAAVLRDGRSETIVGIQACGYR